jgi:hypothetical protein
MIGMIVVFLGLFFGWDGLGGALGGLGFGRLGGGESFLTGCTFTFLWDSTSLALRDIEEEKKQSV